MYFDLFFEDIPTRDIGNDSESIYAIAKITRNGDTLYHCHVTKEQYLSIGEEDSKTLKNASKLASKIFRKVDKKDGTNDDCPFHAFGNSVVDPDGKTVYKVNTVNKALTNDEVAEMLYVDPKLKAAREEFIEVLNGK